MITPAKDIEFIVGLYPHPLRTLQTVFQLDIEGATCPFFLYSQVAFALIQTSLCGGDSLERYINYYRKEDNPYSLVVVDDGELLDIQIVFIMLMLYVYKDALLLDITTVDRTR